MIRKEKELERMEQETEKADLVMTDAAEAHAKARADKEAIAAAQAAEQGSRD